MTPAEIVTEISKLPPSDWETIKKTVDGAPTNGETKRQLTEHEINTILFHEGIIGNIPDPTKYADYDDDFEPIEIIGEPLSETIIRERR